MAFSQSNTSTVFETLDAFHLVDEEGLVSRLIDEAALTEHQRTAISLEAEKLITVLRQATAKPSLVDALLQQYELSNEEGVLLMRLAEALIRTPDASTACYLLRDRLLKGHWSKHLTARHSLVRVATLGLLFAKGWSQLTGGAQGHTLAWPGDRLILACAKTALAALGRHFVLGTSIGSAVKRARKAQDTLTSFSYDMLGEAALTASDAERYFATYSTALKHLAEHRTAQQSLHEAAGLSVKLSALHPRYELAQADRCVPALLEKLVELGVQAKDASISLTIDAEESERLEVSLLIFERLLERPELEGWNGLGLVVQAYQKRALPVIDWVAERARQADRKITIRLVKGAYWDSEIKHAQELGLSGYPVFTRKENTDVSYLACAARLLEASDTIYPQFATHNAHTAAAIVHMAGDRRDLEFQRLFGMSDVLHRSLSKQYGFRSRTYAPVGRHKELLPYLVRRLLENGANSSFVNQLLDPDISPKDLALDPIARVLQNVSKSHPNIPAPRDHLGGQRPAAEGYDLDTVSMTSHVERLSLPKGLSASGIVDGILCGGDIVRVTSPSDPSKELGSCRLNTVDDIDQAARAAAASTWSEKSATARAEILRKAACRLEAERDRLMALCVAEAGKAWPDAEAELREAVDFLRYYADQAEEADRKGSEPLGTVACISPWNFPLAIFLGQVSAALAAGNGVIVKPAEQTPLIAFEAVKILHQCGVPEDALHLILGEGEIGAALVRHPDIAAICFTGSTQTAKHIATSLAETRRAEIPFIAETGGINAMIVDSTALLEQVVQDVLASAFQSAGQRCSACRLVCVQDDVADAFTEMLAGAMAELRVDDPSLLQSDLGPVIDRSAAESIKAHVAKMGARHSLIARTPMNTNLGETFIAPVAIELSSISELNEEVFGPVLHVVRFKVSEFEKVIEAINAKGYGLTMGLHTRVDTRIKYVSKAAQVGNLYVNRNQIGAVVGVQPFGGQGLSGTGPKAGGPNYLSRLCRSVEIKSEIAIPGDESLPGPTGEENILTYVPRGRLLCLGGDSADILERQIARVRATGNEPVIVQSLDDGFSLIDSDIDGVVADGDLRARVATKIARREGAILPLMSAFDPPQRYFLERVITENITAAGGNASLLAMS